MRVFAQDATPIKGSVLSVSGLFLQGVTVKIVDNETHKPYLVSTDSIGVFIANMHYGHLYNLYFSYVGYFSDSLVNFSVSRGENNSILMRLREDRTALNDVVVVGYGTQKRENVTSSIVSVGAEEIRSRPVANALEAIQGKAAGVDVTTSERPGTMGSILIRGVRSISGGNSPLYVIDGVPLNFGGIDAINPNDIERIDILKDASATAIYGSRGANGVVLITTKSGKAGTMTVNYYNTVTMQTLEDRTKMMNSPQYIEFRRDAYRRASFLNPNAAASTTYPATPTEADDYRIFGTDPYAWANVEKGWTTGTWDGNAVPTTDWTGMVKRTGVIDDQNISISGGTQKIKAYGSFGYFSQKGVMLGQDYTRYSSKVGVDMHPLKWFSMGVSINFTYALQNYGYYSSSPSGAGTIYAAAQGMLPYAVPFDSLGNRIDLPGGDVNILNPIGENKYTTNLRKTLRGLGSVYAELQLLKGLKYRISFGPDLYSYYNGIFEDSMSMNRGGGVPGSTDYAQLNQTSNTSWTLDNLIYYDRTFAKHHAINVTLLHESMYNRSENSSMTGINVLEKSKWYALNSVSALSGFSTGLTENSLESYMGRVNYSYDDKYLLTAFMRWDGASVLAAGHKWDQFPSVSVAWRLDKENFMQKLSWIDQLKLRFGMATVGNAAVTPYTTLGALQPEYYTWGSTVEEGYVASDASLANPMTYPDQDLKWEHTTQYNLGLDFSVFKNRLSGSVDVYSTRTTDLLMDRNIPSVNGYVTMLTNIGSTAGKGIDVTLNSLNLQAKDFSWNTSLSFSANRDKIVSLATGKVNDVSNLWFIGQRISVDYDYKKIGIWQNTTADLAAMAKFNANGNNFQPGDIKIADLDNNGVINASDRMILGHAQPNWLGGMTNNFAYRNWGLSVFVYARWGATITGGKESLQGRYAQRLVDYWTPANPTNDYPAPNYASAAGDPYVSSMNYQNGSFIRIRNITLSYNLPAAIGKKIQLSNLKIYGEVINPTFIYSGVKFLDPDTGTSTFNRGYVLGINASFL